LRHYGNIVEYSCCGDEQELTIKIIPVWFTHLNPLFESPVYFLFYGFRNKEGCICLGFGSLTPCKIADPLMKGKKQLMGDRLIFYNNFLIISNIKG